MKWFLAGFLVCWARLALSGELEAPLKDTPLLQVQCKVGTEWESFCHQCRCLVDGTAYCLKIEPCALGVVGEPITCKPNTIFKNGCSVCRCLIDGQVTCTTENCPESNTEIPKKSELVSGKECASGSKWTSQCNQCVCNDEGFPVCTENTCPDENNERGFRCAPNTTWKNDCNTCLCTDEGYATCTRVECVSDALVSKIPELVSGKECASGSEWTSQCNQCFCNAKGFPVCTENTCPEGTNERVLPCAPGTTWRNDCNTCWCTDNGYTSCTKVECVSDALVPKVPELVSGKRCASGSKWTSQCNQCVCNAEGYPVCTKNTCSDDNNERVFQCAPETTWKNDCNTCWCTDVGIATCTRMGCASDALNTDFHVDDDDESEQKLGTASDNEIEVILIDDSHNLLKRSVCKPNKEFQMDCNPCKCAADGQSFTCERNECMETDSEPKINKDVEVFMESEGVDHIERHFELVCKPRAIFFIGCNPCYCNRDGSDFDCTNKPCPLPKDVEVFRDLKVLRSLQKQTNGTKAIICSANRMFIKDCNTCWCNEDGTSYFCTRKVCIIETPEDSIDETQEKEERVTQKCRPDEVFEMDCNMCRCNAEGTSFSCTRRACYPDDDSKDMSLSRKTRAAPQEPPKQCQPGQVFRLDCNKCLCDNEGQDFSCTRIDCNALKNTINSGARRKRDTTEEVSANCTAGSVYQQDCNVCRCGPEGRTATCTTHNCDEVKADDGVNAPATDPNFRCNPGEQFKSECNDCTCTADGKSVFCTLRLCPVYKP